MLFAYQCRSARSTSCSTSIGCRLILNILIRYNYFSVCNPEWHKLPGGMDLSFLKRVAY